MNNIAVNTQGVYTEKLLIKPSWHLSWSGLLDLQEHGLVASHAEVPVNATRAF
jgi:hypothetical protein